MPVRTLVVAATLSGIVRGSTAAAQGPAGEHRCERGTIGRIEIKNNSLFSPDDIRGHRFPWALRIVNGAHFRTRESYVRNSLLLSEGRCYDPDALAASVRLLRDLNFIARVQTDARRLADSTWAVRVETWDEWSTLTALEVESEGTLQLRGFSVTETNTLGQGFSLAIRHKQLRERNDLTVALATSRFMGTRAEASITGGTTRTGRFFRQEIIRPFLSEDGRNYFRLRLQRDDRDQVYATGDARGVSNLLLPVTDESLILVAQRRSGVPGALALIGGELQLRRPLVSERVRQVVRRDFEGATPASDALAARLKSQDAPDSYARIGATIGFRRIRFTEAKGLDLVTGVQNVALGSEITLTVGRTVGTWGTAATDSYGWLEGFASGSAGAVLANATIRAEARYLDAAAAGESRWRDLRLDGRALLYLHSQAVAAQTFVTGVRFDLRDNVHYLWQGALGGETGVRGYRDDGLPTGSAVTAFVEERVNLPEIHPALDLGLTGFADLGRGSAGHVPFGLDTGWRSSVGCGIRIGFPAGTGAVAHVELAWPIGFERAGQPAFRAYYSTVYTSR